jgi:voltage-gated potassium channel
MSTFTGNGHPARERPRIERFIARISPGRAIGLVIAVAVGMAVLGALVLRLVNPAALPSFGDSTWLSVTTITTVGFGDVVPSNASGRVVTGVLALLGISLIPVLTSVVVSVLLGQDDEARADQSQALLEALERHSERLDRIERRLPQQPAG